MIDSQLVVPVAPHNYFKSLLVTIKIEAHELTCEKSKGYDAGISQAKEYGG